MEEALNERASILEKIIPNLFKLKEPPKESLVKSICIHQALAANPFKISSLKSLKINVEAIFEKYNLKTEISLKTTAKTCPFSKGPIEVPWEGQCGHIYDEKHILEYLKGKQQYCVVHGCNKRLIKKE